MQNSAFDLEVYVKHRQDQMHREIERANQLDAARARGQVSRTGPGEVLTRLLASARSWFIGQRSIGAPACEPTVVAPVAPANEALPAPAPHRPRPVPAGDAYAGLVVIARASSVPVSKQPSAVGEC